MNTIEFTLALGLGSLVAGFLGALTGLGGGVVIVPLLVLGFRGRYPLRHRGLPGFGDRHVVRRRRRVCPRRLHRGYIEPGLALPVVLGVLLGSMQGARVLAIANPGRLRLVFTWVIALLGVEMLFNGVTGRL